MAAVQKNAFCDNFSKYFQIKKQEWKNLRDGRYKTGSFYDEQMATITADTIKKLDLLLHEMIEKFKITDPYHHKNIYNRRDRGVSAIKKECSDEFYRTYKLKFDEIFNAPKEKEAEKLAYEFCQSVIAYSNLPAGQALQEIKANLVNNQAASLKLFIIESFTKVKGGAVSSHDRDAPSKLASNIRGLLKYMLQKYMEAYDIVRISFSNMTYFKIVWEASEVLKYEEVLADKIGEYLEKSKTLGKMPCSSELFKKYDSYVSRMNTATINAFQDLYALIFRLTETIR